MLNLVETADLYMNLELLGVGSERGVMSTENSSETL